MGPLNPTLNHQNHRRTQRRRMVLVNRLITLLLPLPSMEPHIRDTDSRLHQATLRSTAHLGRTHMLTTANKLDSRNIKLHISQHRLILTPHSKPQTSMAVQQPHRRILLTLPQGILVTSTKTFWYIAKPPVVSLLPHQVTTLLQTVVVSQISLTTFAPN